MEVRIGISNIVKELELDLGDGADVDGLVNELESKLSSGDAILWLTDKKGRRVGVPATKLGYIDLGAPSESHKVGFGGPSMAVKPKK